MNFFNTFFDTATKNNDKLALVIPNYQELDFEESEQISYGELLTKIRIVEINLKKMKIKKGQKVVLLFSLSVDFFTTFFALSSLGAIIILPNAKEGLKGILKSLNDIQADTIITTAKTKFVLNFFPQLWSISKINIKKITQPFLGKIMLQTKEMNVDDTLLITFTSGSSGKPKGVIRTHQTLIEQHKALKNEFPSIENQIDLTGFPVVTLHNLCLGVTTVLPRVNFKEVSTVNPSFLVTQINQFQINTFCAAPAYTEKLVNFVKDKNIDLKAYAIGGAPVSKKLLNQTKDTFQNASGYVIYGSSEAEPISLASIEQVLSTNEFGYCVGNVSKDVSLKIIDFNQLKNYQGNSIDLKSIEVSKGEIIVSGKHVCTQYYNNQNAFLKNKLIGIDGTIWHRTGDLAYFSASNDLILVGRKENFFKVNEQGIYHYEIESFVNQIFEISRSALIFRNDQVILFVNEKKNLEKDIQKAVESRFKLKIHQLIFIQHFPLDNRHNSKIDYPMLKTQF